MACLRLHWVVLVGTRLLGGRAKLYFPFLKAGIDNQLTLYCYIGKVYFMLLRRKVQSNFKTLIQEKQSRFYLDRETGE